MISIPITPTVLLPTNTSGKKLGSLAIADGEGATQYKSFEIEVSPRTFEVSWQTKK